MGLLLKANPNVLGHLWLRPEHYLTRSPEFDTLIAERDIFSSLRAAKTFAGYAQSQLKKMAGGAFQGYTLGNILSGMYYAQTLKARPEIPSEIQQGKFDTLHTWMRDNIYTYGSKFTADELTEKVTGGPLRIQPYIDYLKTKYGELYKL